MRKIGVFFMVFLIVIGICNINVQSAGVIDLSSLKPDDMNYSFQYTHSSKNRLVVNGYSFYDFIIIGHLEVKEVEKNMFVQSVSAKYNLTPQEDFVIKVPFKYKKNIILSGTTAQNEYLQESEDFGMGDIELTLRRHHQGSNEETEVEFLTLKTNTGTSPYNVEDDEIALGTGHLGLKAGLTRMKRLDPVMLFGGASYCINFHKEVNTSLNDEKIELIDPGNTFQYSLGMAYALNNRIMLSSRIEHSLIGDSEINGEERAGTGANMANLYLELNYLSEKDVNYKYMIGFGLTEDSPDFSFTFSRPINLF